MKIRFLIEGKEPQPRLGIIDCIVREGVNQISRIDLSLISQAELTEEECEDLLGKKIALSFGDAVDGELQWSRFDGVVFECRIPDRGQIMDGFYRYFLVARPAVWRLNFDTRSKSFPDKSRIDVIEEVLISHGFRKDVDFKTSYQTTSCYLKLDQVLQSETSDLGFLQQLMREAGINYYFGCAKDGEEEQLFHLVDNSVFFPKPHGKPIPVTSSLAGRDTEKKSRHIASFDTCIQATPASVVATANLGDGLARSFEYSRDVPKGTVGTLRVLMRHGQESVAKHASVVLSQAIESRRVFYEGRANHFLIRAGEKISVQKELAGEPSEVLVVSAVHRLSQNAVVALGDELDPLYDCHFVAIRSDVEYRPSFQGVSQVLDKQPTDRSPWSSAPLFEEASDDRAWGNARMHSSLSPDLAQLRQEQPLCDVAGQVGRAQEPWGVMVGTVTKDAYVTSGSELVCKISNEAFPVDIVARVALGWLSNMGWSSFLPRVGMQVYFLLTQGAGGQNEAVIIGYRPTSTYKALDPAGTTKTAKLAVKTPPELGSKAEEVVVPATYAPSNRQRNTLLGEQGVAEVALIDGGEDSVAIHARQGIHLLGEAEVHIAGASLCEKADTLSQQFGAVERGVVGDQKESIGGNHELTVMGDERRAVQGFSRTEVQGNVEVVTDGESVICLQNGKDTKLELSEDGLIRLMRGSENGLIIETDKGSFSTQKGIVLSVADKLKIDISGEGESITIDRDGDVIELTSDGVNIKTGNVTVQGTKITIKGSQIELTGSMVTVSGSMIKLN